MLPYILKSSACLLVFMLFYTFFLEKESVHTFKRFYLLAAILLAFGIPLITFTEFIEPVLDFGFFDPNSSLTPPYFPAEIPIEEKINYLPTILWSIYGLGALLFGIKFLYNLTGIYTRIRKNPKQKSEIFTNVLLKDLIMPHTFFNYIFLNKQKFETQQIPKEVFWHEQTHANQKHSIDVLLIEVLQVVFWFNPLIYITKRSIKLNHEFLADQAVINKGIQTSNYQEILLAFSSNAQHVELANAINYSSIKKRFTIMNTNTSKQKLWLRSILLLPLLAILIYSFSSTKQVEKELVSKMGPEYINTILSNHTARSISIEVSKDGTYNVDDITATKETFKSVINQLHQDITPEIRNQIINVHVNNGGIVSDDEVWFIYNSLLEYGFHRIVTFNQEIIRSKGNKPFAIVNSVKQQKGISTQATLPTINGIACDKCTVNLSRKGIEKLIVGSTNNQTITSFNIKFPGKPTLNIHGNQLNKKAISYLEDCKIGNLIMIFYIKANKKQLESHINIQLVIKHDKNYSHSPKVVMGEKSDIPPPPKATSEQVAEYNKLAKECNFQIQNKGIVKHKNVERLKHMHSLMTDKQKKKAERYPDFSLLPPPPAPKVVKGEFSDIPPPPPPVPTNATPEQKEKYKKIHDEYNKRYEVKNGVVTRKLPPPPPPISTNASPEERAEYKRVIEEYAAKRKKLSLMREESKMVEREFAMKQRELAMQERELTRQERNIKSPLDHVIDMAKKGATFYLEGKKISSDEAIDALKKNKKLNIQTIDSKVFITKKPILIGEKGK